MVCDDSARVLACVSIVLALATPTRGSSASAQASVVRSARPTDSTAVAYLRGKVPALMKEMDVPGAVVTLVRDGEVLMNEGFGYADLGRHVPVDADRTVFRIASVAKVFTAIAALQQVKAGRLTLQDDVHGWVPTVDLGPTAWKPVTLHSLLTHTAGFDEKYTGYLNPPGHAPPPLEAYVPREMPARTRPDGDVPGYSNHAYGLIGLIVEGVSGTRFDAYVREHIFRPLGMQNTAFVMRPGADSIPDYALEYRATGALRVQRSSKPYPAGNVGTTGHDMARFLLDMLAASSNPPRPSVVITSDLMRQLAGAQLEYHPEMPPMGYGLSPQLVGSQVIWLKGGAGPSHSAVIAVLPNVNAGVFVALNRQEPVFWSVLLRGLAAALDDTARHASAQPRSAGPRPALTGDYRWTRTALASFEKVLGIGTQIRVRNDSAGIRVSGAFGGGHWNPVSRSLFTDSAGRQLAFRMDSAGRATHAFTIEQGQPMSFERIPLLETSRVQLGVLAASAVLALATGIVTLARNRSSDRGGSQPTWARAGTVALPLSLLATVGSALVLLRQGDMLLEGPTAPLYATLALTTATGAAAVWQAAGSATLATRSAAPATVRALYALGSAGGAALLWSLVFNNLIGIRL